MKTVKRIHSGYTEWELHGKPNGMKRSIFGKYQYILSSKKGSISLINLPGYFQAISSFDNYAGELADCWEIYCVGGNLFEDVEKFDTKEAALERCRKLLN